MATDQAWSDADVISEIAPQGMTEKDWLRGVETKPSQVPPAVKNFVQKTGEGLSKGASAVGDYFAGNIAALPRAIATTLASPATLASKGAQKLGNLIEPGWGDEHIADLGELYQAQMDKKGLPGSGGFMTDIAKGAPLFALGAGMLPQVLGNAAYGVIEAEPGQELKQAAIGGGLGLVGRALQGLTPSPGAAQLMEHDIQPTVGQALGGWKNSLEQRIGSFLPGVEAARQRPSREFSTAMLERYAPGAHTIQEANEIASRNFNAIVPHLTPTRDAVINVQKALKDALDNPEMVEHAAMLDRIINRNFSNFGKLDGQGIQRLDQQLGEMSRRYAKGSPNDKVLSDELVNIQRALRDGLESGLPPDLQGAYRSATKQWRDLMPLNKSASRRADELITPRNVQKDIARAAGRDVTRMPYDDLVDPAVKHLGRNIPDSETANRLGIGLQAGAVARSPVSAISTLLASLTGYTRPAQKMMLGGYDVQKSIAPRAIGALGNIAMNRDEAESVENFLRRGQ